MYIFTPNTLIKSNEVNANFSELKNKLDAIKVLRVYFNNGTSTRSSTTSGVYATLPGAVGDVSYTAPVDVDIVFTMTAMMHQTGGAGRVVLRINSTNKIQALYFDSIGGGWQIQSIQYPKHFLSAGETITIGAQWNTASGTFTCTNNNTDEQYPNEIIGIVLPKGLQ